MNALARIAAVTAIALALAAVPNHHPVAPARQIALELRRGILPHHYRDGVERANDMGVFIIWTETPCGWTPEQAGGCFDPQDPHEIQVVPSDWALGMNYAILHELAHARQWRLGLPLNECDADAQAIQWGAPFSGYGCPGFMTNAEWNEQQERSAEYAREVLLRSWH